jgi:hypothetical protein
MSVKASVNRFAQDSLLVLQPAGTAAQTSSGAATSTYALDVLTSYWAAGDVAQELDFACVVEVTAVAGTLPTAAFAVQVSTDPTFASPTGTVVGEIPVVNAVGRVTIVVDRDSIISALGTSPTAGTLRLYATLGGTSPSFTYNAYLSPLPGM